ncbi:MAG: HD domain-containing phosphohydrolase [Alphaproteobacteria bacterium]|nr:HD domain-containing phosphohydrolase [Alphaproteobacteria bacterium]
MSNSDAVAKAIGENKVNVFGKMGLTVIALIIGAIIAFYLVFQFGESERQRELQGWQARMAIVADSRAADVSNWLDEQIEDLKGLSDNASLQLYMSLLHGEDSEDVNAELEYLGNLLTVVAERAGFVAESSGASQVAANVARVGTAGIALLDDEGKLVISSSEFPPLVGKLQAFLSELPKGESGYSKLYLNEDDMLTQAFATPVFDLQGDNTAASHMGMVVGVKIVQEDLQELLLQPGAVEETAESMLVRQNGSSIEYITSLRDGTATLKKKLSMDTPDLAAAALLRDATAFGVFKDYQGKEVLAVARDFEQVPWLLVYKVDRNEALADSDNRVNMLVAVLGMVIVLVVIGMLALWYFGTSKRAKEAAQKFEALAERFQGQRNFMHLVTDSQPNSIVIFDKDGNYRWFNQKVVDASGLKRADLFDKPVSAVLGPIEGKKITAWVKECLEADEPISKTHSQTIGNTDKQVIYRSELIPIPARNELPAGVLMVSQDISDSVYEREKREKVMRQLVSTLVSLVDRRDPFATYHSRRVTEVSRAIAAEMELDPSVAETAAIAGSLMNLGKINVPASILTKQGALSPEERKVIQDSIVNSADLVEEIDFDGPVRDTMRQLLEHEDGSGYPDGLTGEQILQSAKVAAVANVFVGMVSARAWRSGMDFDKASRILFEESGSKYDRAVVSALINILNNRNGREKWASYSVAPEEGV